MAQLVMDIDGLGSASSRTVEVTDLVVAGWTGRDTAAMEHHIAELEALGVARPQRTPTYYRAAAARLTQAPVIEVSGGASSGEAEFVIVSAGGEIFVGLGSDHTDRKVETYSVTVSKQMCDKPVSAIFWPLREVEEHWDSLLLRGYATIDGERVIYQDGGVAGMLPPRHLISDYCEADTLPDGTVMFCGTLPAIGGIRPAERFEAELEDPVLNRRITLRYDVRELPMAG